MNKYEEKFKAEWQRAVDRVASLTNDVKKYQDQIAVLEKDINAIDAAKELLKQGGTAQEAVQALKDKVSELHQNRTGRQSLLERTQEWLTDARKKLRVLQDLCPHENSVYDHTDYHKREDFHKCTLCGDVR